MASSPARRGEAVARGNRMREATMRLTTPTKYVFFSSIVLAAAAIVLYGLGVMGVVAGASHFAFWVAMVAWLALAVGVAAKGV